MNAHKTSKICIVSIWMTALFFMGCLSSKTFSPQDTSTTARNGFLTNEQIDIAFFDSRTDKQHSEKVKRSIIHHLNQTYPDVTFHLLDDSGYLTDTEEGKISLKINIVDYIVRFNNAGENGHWRGRTGISVVLHDYRIGDDRHRSEIFDEDLQPVGIANITPKKALQISFQNVMIRLTAFIDQSLMV